MTFQNDMVTVERSSIQVLKFRGMRTLFSQHKVESMGPDMSLLRYLVL